MVDSSIDNCIMVCFVTSRHARKLSNQRFSQSCLNINVFIADIRILFIATIFYYCFKMVVVVLEFYHIVVVEPAHERCIQLQAAILGDFNIIEYHM